MPEALDKLVHICVAPGHASGHTMKGKGKGKPAGPAAHAKANERVVEWWDGRFPFARIMGPGEQIIGWGVTCGLHTNADGRCAGTPCKKSVTIGRSGLSELEAAKRLKRWLVTAQFHALEPASERQSHVAKGGVQLREYASGTAGWEDLDPDLDILLARC